MSTKYFNLPYIDPNAPFDGAADINKLADAVDSALETVEVLGRDATFTLEPATRTKLGGVIVGNGVEVGQDGTISVNVDPYELPPATHSTLGGVIVGAGINVTPDGVISIDDGAITLPPNSVGTEQILDGAVTAPKIANKTVTFEKLSPSLQGIIDEAVNFSQARAEIVPLSFQIGNTNNFIMYNWGGAYSIHSDKAIFTANGGSTYKVATLQKEIPASLIKFAKVPCEILRENSHVMYGTLELYGKDINLKTSASLSAGDYQLVVDSTFFCIS